VKKRGVTNHCLIWGSVKILESLTAAKKLMKFAKLIVVLKYYIFRRSLLMSVKNFLNKSLLHVIIPLEPFQNLFYSHDKENSTVKKFLLRWSLVLTICDTFLSIIGSAFSPEILFIFFLLFSEQTVIISLNSVNQKLVTYKNQILILVMVTSCFLCCTDWITTYYLDELRLQRTFFKL
jgi:hypothetical protein